MSFDRFLTADEVVDMFRAGHSCLKRNVSMINGLNVFPVPDGDTGTNMELSLASGVRAMESKAGDLHSRFASLATGLLMGARGNSGVILSQLLRGFDTVNMAQGVLDVAAFSQALYEGVTIAYHAVAKPVEGTILTVAREAATAGRREARNQTNLLDWMRVVRAAAQTALDKTPQQLPVLKQAGVVDSGGQGLVCLFEGFVEYLSGEMHHREDDRPYSVAKADVLNLDTAHHEGGFGYCTEVLIRINPLDSAEVQSNLRRRLSEYGDSLLVVCAADLVKVHVHTVEPGRVLQDGLKYGPLVKIKVENMTEQFEEAHRTSNETNQPEDELPIEVPTSPNMQVIEVDAPQGNGNNPMEAKAIDGLSSEETTIIAVAAGKGIESMFHSLGVHAVVHGGRTMNPSTEDLVETTLAALKHSCGYAIILPNHKNVIMAAEQAAQILGPHVQVVPTVDIVQGLAAVLAFKPSAKVDLNVRLMAEAAASAHSGSIVQAARDSEYEGAHIQKGEYLGFLGSRLQGVSSSRIGAFDSLLREMWFDSAELITVFYQDESLRDEREALQAVVALYPGLEMEFQFGGQPIYDYLIALE